MSDSRKSENGVPAGAANNYASDRALDGTAIYLIHYDAPDWLQSACKAIALSDTDLRLTIVNNSDPPLEIDDSVRVLQMNRNGGFTAAANTALRDWMSGTSQYCVIGSHDLHPAENAFNLLRAAMESDPSIGVSGPLLQHDNVMPTPESGTDFVDWVSGTCMMFRRECIREVGLFDERYKSYAEDFDICARARAQGWKVAIVRTATAHGLGTAHSGQSPRRLANSVLFDLKTYGYRGGLKTLLSLMRRVPQAILRGRWREAAASTSALPIAFRHFVSFLVSPAGTPNPWMPEEAGGRVPPRQYQ